MNATTASGESLCDLEVEYAICSLLLDVIKWKCVDWVLENGQCGKLRGWKDRERERKVCLKEARDGMREWK
jgi:hypothetical protein